MSDRVYYRDGVFLFGAFFATVSLDMFTTYTVNGAIDFFTATVLLGVLDIGSSQFIELVVIYLLMAPAFLTLRFISTTTRYPEILIFPFEPDDFKQLLSMDHYANAVFLLSIPAAFQNAGAWVTSIGLFVLTLFILPRAFDAEWRPWVRLGGVLVAATAQAWLTVQQVQALSFVPAPETVLPDVFVAELTAGQTQWLLDVVNSVFPGIFVVPVLGVAMSSVFASDAMEATPFLGDINPESTSVWVILYSSFAGAVTIQVLRLLVAGEVLLFPW
ncbi:hypothetical protein [Haloglomus salinum]|uniref:hypothetical protein n=1 Tax=Haloglomus salinum TaxID=2962673 RepID=UPI0020C962BD|nr:hypothetical protein [Haloglomus salinum]